MTIRITNTAVIALGNGWELATTSDGSPKTTEPIHFKNQAKQPTVSTKAMTTINSRGQLSATAKLPENIANFEKKPLKGGTPAIARAAMVKATAKSGCFLSTPLICGSIRVPMT